MTDKVDRWMTVIEVAHHLRLGRTKIYSMIKNGELPCYRMAGRWRFLRSEIETKFRGFRVGPVAADQMPSKTFAAHRDATKALEPLVLTCGKFQPFHLEHLEYVLAAFQVGEHILIGITNPDPSYVLAETADPKRSLSESNPFSYYQRYRMVIESLSDQGIDRSRYDVLPFPLNVPDSWFSYIPRKALVLVTLYDDDPWLDIRLKKLEQGGLRTRVLWRKSAKGITGTQVRAELSRGGDWKDFVPSGTVRVIEDGDLQERT